MYHKNSQAEFVCVGVVSLSAQLNSASSPYAHGTYVFPDKTLSQLLSQSFYHTDNCKKKKRHILFWLILTN